VSLLIFGRCRMSTTSHDFGSIRPVQLLRLADSHLPFLTLLFVSPLLLLSMAKKTAKQRAAGGTAKRASGPLGSPVPAHPGVEGEVEVARLEVHSQVSSFLTHLLLLIFWIQSSGVSFAVTALRGTLCSMSAAAALASCVASALRSQPTLATSPVALTSCSGVSVVTLSTPRRCLRLTM
jgi:hypothetical protein